MKKEKRKCLSGFKFLFVSVVLCLWACQATLASNEPTYKKKFTKSYRSKVKHNAMQLAFSASYINSAGGHKGGYSANCLFGGKYHLVETGAVLNAETEKIDAVHLRYKVFVVPNNRPASLYFQASAIYHHQSPLKNKLNKAMHEAEYLGSKPTFNTAELSLGMGFQQRFFRQFFADFSIGAGKYFRHLAGEQDHRKDDYRRFGGDKGYGVNIKFALGYYLW